MGLNNDVKKSIVKKEGREEGKNLLPRRATQGFRREAINLTNKRVKLPFIRETNHQQRRREGVREKGVCEEERL